MPFALYVFQLSYDLTSKSHFGGSTNERAFFYATWQFSGVWCNDYEGGWKTIVDNGFEFIKFIEVVYLVQVRLISVSWFA